jgi:hypothetical protein
VATNSGVSGWPVTVLWVHERAQAILESGGGVSGIVRTDNRAFSVRVQRVDEHHVEVFPLFPDFAALRSSMQLQVRQGSTPVIEVLVK